MAGKESEHNSKRITSKPGKSLGTVDEIVDRICRDCGDKTMRNSYNYMRRARYFIAADQFDLQVFGETGFYFGVKNKTSYRLIAIAVRHADQGKGFGALMLASLIERCVEFGYDRITLRAHKQGEAVEFWKKMGADIVGEKGDDYEMKITI